MSTAPRSAFPWHVILIAGLTGGLLWMFFRDIDFGATWRAMTNAKIPYLIAAVLTTFVVYLVRSLRWQAMLRPVGPARLGTVFRATVIGFTAIFLVGRFGEAIRPFVVTRHDGLKYTATLATVVVERLLDVVTVLLLFAASLPLLGVDVGQTVRTAGLVAGAGSLVALALLFVMAGHPERLARWAESLGKRLPGRLNTVLQHAVQAFAEGLVVMRRPADLLVVIGWSLPIWFSIALQIWLTSHAFDLTLSFVGAFLVVGYLAVGVSVPTPGGAGSFHVMYKEAVVRFFGADPDVAVAVAIILHAVSFVPVTLLGLFYMWQDGLTLGSFKRIKSEAEAAETP